MTRRATGRGKINSLNVAPAFGVRVLGTISRIMVIGIVLSLVAVPLLASAHHLARSDPRIVWPYGVPVAYHQAIVAGYEPLPAPPSCGVAAAAPDVATVYDESFEGTHGWTVTSTPLARSGNTVATNLWRVSTFAGPGDDAGHNGASRLWFGNPTSGTFNNGHVAGTMQSPPVDLPLSPAVLVWAEKWQTESLKGYDHLWVELTDEAGKIHLLCHSNSQVRADPDGIGGGSFQTSCSPNIVTPCKIGAYGATPMAWMTRSVPIPATLLGSVVRVQFTFDSSDPAANWFMGWMVDDVQIVAAPVG